MASSLFISNIHYLFTLFVIVSFEPLITDANTLKCFQIMYNNQENQFWPLKFIYYICCYLYDVISFDDVINFKIADAIKDEESHISSESSR